MNIDRLSTLAAWLEDGAPGVAFNMFTFRHTIGTVLGPEGDPCDALMIKRQVAAKGLSLSDICCGLDGATVQLFLPEYPVSQSQDYGQLQDLALNLLGLLGCVRPTWIAGMISLTQVMRHRLQPEQAAKAVRRLIAGQDPWI